MKNNEKHMLIVSDGRTVEAQAPVIISASRSTDIPAFYCDWFFHRLKEGYSAWKNPFNGKSIYISYEKTRFIVFWSKNPRPLLNRLDELKDRGIGCYVQFSLNDYAAEGFEPNVPPLDERLDTFSRLVEKLGKGGVVWRNDPLVLTDKVGIDDLLLKTQRIGDILHGLTEKLVFSYVDVNPTARRNLASAGVAWREWTESDKLAYAKELSKLNAGWGYELATCAEDIGLEEYGIQHSRCVDDRLIIRRAWRDAELMAHLGVKVEKTSGRLFTPPSAILLGNGLCAIPGHTVRDAGQRKACGCIKSKDSGEYSTCRHYCAYCYANAGRKAVEVNCAEHGRNPHSENITGKPARVGNVR